MNDVSVSRLNTVVILWSNESMTMSFNQNIIYLFSSMQEASMTSADFEYVTNKYKQLKIYL